MMATEAGAGEHESIVATYLAEHQLRGGLLTNEVRQQAEQYAQRIVENRAYEQRLAQQARETAERAAVFAARQAVSSKRQIVEANRQRVDDSAAGEAWAKQVAANVAYHSDTARIAREAQAAEARRQRALAEEQEFVEREAKWLLQATNNDAAAAERILDRRHTLRWRIAVEVRRRAASQAA